MTDDKMIFNRQYGLENLMDPQGNVYGIGAADGGHGLYFIGKVTEDNEIVQLRSLPDPSFAGLFTHKDRAKAVILKHLEKFWDKSDEAIAASKAKRTPERQVAAG